MMGAAAEGRLRQEVRNTMRQEVSMFYGPTELAEYAADIHDMNTVGGPLDDETHWIWEIALEEWEAVWGDH